MGWFDAVASRFGCQIQGATSAALTAIDVLSYLEEIPVCIGYEIDGQITRDFPATAALNRAKPVLQMMPGWHKINIRGVTDFAKLPQAAQDYVLFVEREIGVPVRLVSTGPRREEIIYR
jgi:adenylosuccinate synthase